jgi:hypothetical protein
LEERKIEQLEKAAQQKSMSTQQDEDYHFWWVCCLILGTYRKGENWLSD